MRLCTNPCIYKYCHCIQFSSVQSLSYVWLFATPWTAERQASLSITNSWSSPKFMSIESVMPSNHLIICRPLLLLLSVFPSIRVFSNESALHIRWPKYWNFSFNMSPSSEHPGLISFQFSSVQLLSHVRLFATPWIAARQASLSITNSRSSLRLMSIESVMPSSHLILCRPLLILPSIFPSIRVSSNESALHIRWPKDWSFSFNISPSNKYSRLISFRIDWLDHLAVQGTLKSLLQHHSPSISSSVLSFLCSPTLTSIHDYWKNHTFD